MLHRLTAHAPPLRAALLVFLLGLAWMLAFPVAVITQGRLGPKTVFISENAVPKLYTPRTARSTWPPFSPDALRHQYNSTLIGTTASVLTSDVDRLAYAVAHTLRSHGAVALDVDSSSCGGSATGTPIINVVGVVHGTGRMASQEAVLLATHVTVRQLAADSPSSFGPSHPLFATLWLTSLLADARWLAKDVVVLVTVSHAGCPCAPSEHCATGASHRAGVDAWAAATLDDTPTRVRYKFQPGLLRGAVLLDWDASVLQGGPTNLGVLVAGPDGRLPDLDIVTLALFSSPLQPTVLPLCAPHADDYWTRLTGLLQFMKTLALGPYGPHSVLLSRNIDSFTITAVRGCEGAGTPPATVAASLAAVTETVLHALSTVEERLHASYYLYLFMAPAQYFVPFGEYFPSFGLVLVAPALLVMLRLHPAQRALLPAAAAVARLHLATAAVCVFVYAAAAYADSSRWAWLLAAGLVVAHAAAAVAGVALVAQHAPPDTRVAMVAMCEVLFTMPLIPLGLKNFPAVVASAIVAVPLFWLCAHAVVSSSVAAARVALMWSLCLHPGTLLAVVAAVGGVPAVASCAGALTTAASPVTALLLLLLCPSFTVLASVAGAVWLRPPAPLEAPKPKVD